MTPQRSPGGAEAPALLQFDDNRLLPELFGEHDKHLVRIEQTVGVSLINRGNRLAIEGSDEAAEIAREALSRLYQRLKGGQAVDTADVDAAVRMASEPTNLFGEQDPIIRTRRKQISPRTPNQGAYIEAIRQNDLVFGLGPAGTGKTYLAVCIAVAMYLNNQVERIVLTRPAVEAGERLGFLPGDMKEKVDPYLRPLYDALYDMLPADQVARRLDSGEIEIAPLAFMRGRTLNNAFVILDEAQNTTPEQMKMFLTRIGFGSKAVVTGDVTQIDLPRTQLSGLIDAERVLKRVNGIGFTRLTSADVVRHPLVARIVDAYEARSPSVEEAEPARRRRNT